MKSISLVVVLAVASAASFAHAADLIYQDNFDGTAGVLNGRALPVASGLDGGTAAATWTSDAAPTTNPDAVWQATGGTYTVTGSTSATIGDLATGADANLITNAFLPFVPQAGFVYDLHLAVESSSTGASGNWLGVAFAQANLNGHTTGGGSSALSNDNPYGLIILKGSGAVQAFGGLGTANGVTLSPNTVTAGTFIPVDIVLDTSNPAWQVSWKLSGSTAGNFTYATNPNIGALVFGTNKLTGAVSDFSLTATAVPEPAALSVMAVGALALLARRRK